MVRNVVYEGTAMSPLYEVQWGSREKQAWSSRGANYTSLENAIAEARLRESKGYDTQIVQHRKEGSK